MIKYYLVGGAVRDKIMGIKSKDLDYSVEAPSYESMVLDIISKGGTIWQERPEYLTVRAKLKGQDADFVLCRKDGQYFDGRRPDSVEVGTLYDDLARRDFTMNAIAMDEDGQYIDPYDGRNDIITKTIRCVGSPYDRFNEDGLRMIRALRFCVTKKFGIDYYTYNAIAELQNKIAEQDFNRVRDELTKMFKTDTIATLRVLGEFRIMENIIFGKMNIWLKPTSEER